MALVRLATPSRPRPPASGRWLRAHVLTASARRLGRSFTHDELCLKMVSSLKEITAALLLALGAVLALFGYYDGCAPPRAPPCAPRRRPLWPAHRPPWPRPPLSRGERKRERQARPGPRGGQRGSVLRAFARSQAGRRPGRAAHAQVRAALERVGGSSLWRGRGLR
eukprot:2276736-Prymnesium_polylepis.1